MNPHKDLAAVMLVAAGVITAPPSDASSLDLQTNNVNSGTVAARLAVSKTCTAGDATIPNGPLSGDPSVEPCGELAANDVDIVSSPVVFRAGSGVRLGNGFSVATNATFTVETGSSVLGDSYVRDESPAAETNYYVRFYIDPDGLTLDDDGDRFAHLVAYDGQGNPEFVIGLTFQSGLGEKRLFTTAFGNDGTAYTTADLCELALGPDWQYVEAHWKASTGTNGDVELSINGGAPQSLSQCLALTNGLENGNGEISAVEWGAQGVTGGDLGTLDIDDFDSQRTGPIGSL